MQRDIFLDSGPLLYIISKADYHQLRKLSMVNKKFNKLCLSEEHYFLRFTSEYPHINKSKSLSYEKIYKMCKHLENDRAKIINVPKTLYKTDPDMDPDDEDMETLNNAILPYVLDQGANRGDIIYIGTKEGYRNENKYVFDGDKIIHLSYEPDEYGCIPYGFEILDDDLTFSAIYWLDVIAHNRIFRWDTKPYLDQLIKNFEEIKANEETYSLRGKTFTRRTYIVQTSFIHSSGIPFLVRIEMGDTCSDESLIDYISSNTFELSENSTDDPYIIQLTLE